MQVRNRRGLIVTGVAWAALGVACWLTAAPAGAAPSSTSTSTPAPVAMSAAATVVPTVAASPVLTAEPTPVPSDSSSIGAITVPAGNARGSESGAGVEEIAIVLAGGIGLVASGSVVLRRVR